MSLALPHAAATPVATALRSAADAVGHARQAITPRRLAWATGIALALCVTNVIGLLPPVLSLVPNLLGRSPTPWTMTQYVGAIVDALVAAYCILLAVGVAEYGSWSRRALRRRYVVAGVAGCSVALAIETVMFILAPSLAPPNGGWDWPPDARLVGRVLWSAANFALCVGLVLAVYVRFRSARVARESFNAAELERVAASREVLASRLTAMQARIEPQFLLSTLGQVEALYDRDAQAGDRMLDALIAYLHAALPQLRSERSNLAQEVQLAESYLRIVQIRMGSRLEYRVDVRAGLGGCDFPPMLLLPLIDDALRNGLEPLAGGGMITLTADADGDRMQVCVRDNGLPLVARSGEAGLIATLEERVRALYGDVAQLSVAAPDGAPGLITTIEVPLASARAHR